MKKTLHRLCSRIGLSTLAVFMTVVMALPLSDLSAQNRPGRGSDPTQRERRHDNRPGNRPDNSNRGQRPVNRPGQRPSHNNNNNGNHNNGGNRPNHRPDNRPGNRPDNRPNHRPNHRPDHRPDNRPGNRPGHGNNWGHPTPPPPARPSYGRPHRPGHSAWHPAPPPHRPYRPVMRPWRPPVPPPAWRPVHRGPSFATVLGIALGTALYNSVNDLIAAGYTVDGYQDGVVYLRDLNQYNYFWPDATLRYDNGYLVGSEYMYTTPMYDLSRYTGVYNYMYSMYGAPVSVAPPGSGTMTATWFGPGQCYITLEYRPMTFGGTLRYCTTLSQGRY